MSLPPLDSALRIAAAMTACNAMATLFVWFLLAFGANVVKQVRAFAVAVHTTHTPQARAALKHAYLWVLIWLATAFCLHFISFYFFYHSYTAATMSIFVFTTVMSLPGWKEVKERGQLWLPPL